MKSKLLCRLSAVLSIIIMTGIPLTAYESAAVNAEHQSAENRPYTAAVTGADFDFINLPAGNAATDTFIIGENTQSITARRYVKPFSMNKYETSYNLWYTVRIQAEKDGYVFANPGQEGSAGRRGRAPTAAGKYQPVTMINWYDAIVWCNALSEQTGRTPVYTFNGKVLRDSTETADCDLTVSNWQANGFRLPTETEWEYAARKTSSGYQRGDLASGAVDEYGKSDDSINEGTVAWYDGNANSTHTVGTASTPFSVNAAPGSGKPNALGFFDMSGNVLEFCWDWFETYEETEPAGFCAGPEVGAERISRGGSWSPYTGFIFTGDRYAYDPNETYNYMGFRIASSAPVDYSE